MPRLILFLLAWLVPLASGAQVIVSSTPSLAVPVVDGVQVGHAPSTVTGVVPTGASQCLMSAPTAFATTDPSYQTCPAGVAGNPAGATTLLQYNNAGVFGGTTGLAYADPTTLAPAGSGWKFGANGLTAAFANPSVGNDGNLRRAIDIFATSDSTLVNPNFAHDSVLRIRRDSLGPGLNSRDAQSKFTFANIELESNDIAAGQHFAQVSVMRTWGMGDVYVQDMTAYVWGGANAVGDEGQGIQRLHLEQGQYLATAQVSTAQTQTTCNTTLTQAVTKNRIAQAVTVASTTGCNVNDRVVIDHSNMVGSNPRMEVVKITAVGAGTITGIFRESHISGAAVVPSVKVFLSTVGNMGEGRYLVNLTTTAYTTGTVTGISGTEFTGTGTTWTSGMVGGTTLVPGCIALTADDYTGAPFGTGSNTLKGWFGIASVTDATHLFIAHTKAAAIIASYEGKGPGTGEYTVRPCARILSMEGNNLYLEPNSFPWTTGHLVEAAMSVDLSVPAIIRANMAVYSPNAYVAAGMLVSNIGQAPIQAAFLANQGLKQDNTQPGFGGILVSAAHTSGPLLNFSGAISESGELLNVTTGATDNKYIRWNTTGGTTRLGVDNATGNLKIAMDGASIMVVANTTESEFHDIKTRQWISNGVTFANLGTPTNGSMVYCSNCTIAAPCASGGTGAFAKRLNNAWNCQ